MSNDDHKPVMVQLAKLEGQLQSMTQLMQHNHDSTHQRINDFRHAVEGRIAGVEGRVDRLEANERSTAVKAGIGGMAGAAIMSAAVKVFSSLGN